MWSFFNLYSSPNIVRMIRARMIRFVEHIVCTRNTYKILVGKREGERPLGILSTD
jgi:hypothetical protein